MNNTVPEDIREALDLWEEFYSDHLDERGHHGEILLTRDGNGEIVGYQLVCCDEDGNATCCGHDETRAYPSHEQVSSF